MLTGLFFDFLDLRQWLGRRKDTRYHVYTDGSSKGGLGAWAFVVLKNDRLLYEASGKVRNANSNRMEIQAAVCALKWLPEGSTALMHTDSRILLDCVTKDLGEWKAKNWINQYGRPVFNADLFQELHSLCEKRLVSWKWIRAHAGNPHNERCDALCVQARSTRL